MNIMMRSKNFIFYPPSLYFPLLDGPNNILREPIFFSPDIKISDIMEKDNFVFYLFH